MSQQPKNPGLMVSVLVLLVAVLTVSIVGLVAYFAIVKEQAPTVTEESSSTQSTLYPSPADPRQDVADWSDLTGPSISKLFGILPLFSATDGGKVVVDRCAYVLNIVNDLENIGPAPVLEVETTYRAWVGRLQAIVSQCSETLNTTDDFATQTKIAIDGTAIEFSLFQTELSLYVDLNRR